MNLFPSVSAVSGSSPLRVLSYNIQTGISTRRYHQYLTHSWKHVVPHRRRQQNLDRIAELVAHYDLVGLQEVDSGSLRSGFVNQTEYLAKRAGFPYWYSQTNRDLGMLAQQSVGLLSRYPADDVQEIRLPGRIPGRGALCVRFGGETDHLLVLTVHLALGPRARREQLEYLARFLTKFDQVILMGDFNCSARSPLLARLARVAGLQEPVRGLHTFPSWRPYRSLDHILVSRKLKVSGSSVPDYTFSDHLPIATEVQCSLPGIVAREIETDELPHLHAVATSAALT